MLPHAPYSPYMSLSGFGLFPKLKQPIRGRSFSSLREFRSKGTRAIRHMNKSGLLDGIIMLHKRWDSVIEKQEDYIEGLWTDSLKEMKMLVKEHGRIASCMKWRACDEEKRKKGWRMNCDVGEATEGLENELWRWWSDEKLGEWA